jgi:hypothetical protein
LRQQSRCVIMLALSVMVQAAAPPQAGNAK